MIDFKKYINKKVSVKIYARDNNGHVVKGEYTTINGLCSFAGYNNILNINQITINRLPLFENEIFSVEIVD